MKKTVQRYRRRQKFLAMRRRRIVYSYHCQHQQHRLALEGVSSAVPAADAADWQSAQ